MLIFFRVDLLGAKKDPFLEKTVLREVEECHKRRKHMIVNVLPKHSTDSPEERKHEDEKLMVTHLHSVTQIGVEGLEVSDSTWLGPSSS